MNIIEAIKSGKRFRRAGTDRYLHFVDVEDGIRDDGGLACFSYSGLLADDWEVEESMVPITEQQLDDIIKGSTSWGAVQNGLCLVDIAKFKEELGFKGKEDKDKVRITRSQVEDAIGDSRMSDIMSHTDYIEIRDSILQKLGFT